MNGHKKLVSRREMLAGAAVGRILPPPKEVELDALFMVWDIILPRG